MRKVLPFIFTSFIFMLSALPAQAQDKEPTIVAIEVFGNQIVSNQTVTSKMKSQKGAVLRQQVVNEDIRRLYSTGFFEDIQIDLDQLPEGYKLLVFVEEKPIIMEIIIEGHTIFKDDKLRKTLGVIEGQILDQKAVKDGVLEIKKLYANKGFKFIHVDLDFDINEESKESVIRIKIAEGKKYKIKDVIFVGNESFEDKELQKLMKNKPKKWFFFGAFKEEDFQQDLERIYFFYQKEGFLDAQVSPEFEYDEKEGEMIIKVLIEENRQYETGKVSFSGNELFPEGDLWSVIEMLPGMTYSQFYIAEDLEKLRSYYFEKGYIEVRIVPSVDLNQETGKVDIIYQIDEGDLFFVEKVLVRGNTKTKDKVIRRELRIFPGGRFDGDQIKKSKQRLDNLGYFEEVTYDIEPSDAGVNRKDLIFRVKEKRTGELSFGGGVSSVDNFVGFAEISQRNFDIKNWPRLTGGGQSVSLRGRIGSISQDFILSFVEPYLFDKPYSLGIDAYNNIRNSSGVDFEETRLGLGISLSKMINDKVRAGIGLVGENVKIDELSSDVVGSLPAPPGLSPLETITGVEGDNLLGRFRTFVNYDSRDSHFAPTKGSQAGASLEFVGIDHEYIIAKANYTKFFSFFKKHVLETGLRLGQSAALTGEVPVFDRFFAGGLGSVRGFNYRRVGPIDRGDATGGESQVIVNLDYTFPLPWMDSLRGVVFLDAGNITDGTFDAGDTAASVGPGVKVKTPLGPVALYYGYPIYNEDVEDDNGRFEFSLSRGF